MFGRVLNRPLRDCSSDLFCTWDKYTLREKCPYSELFWSAFSRIRTEFGKIRTRITPNTDTFYSVIMAVITTVVMRCLGIPCRSVTNFESAHDTQGNCTDDHYLDENWDEISSLSSDSIW